MGIQARDRPNSNPDQPGSASAARRTLWLPLAIGIAGIAASLLLSNWLRAFEGRHPAFIADAEASRAAAELQRDMRDRLDAFDRLARTHSGALRAKESWHVDLIGLQAALWADSAGKVSSVVPLEGHEDLVGLDLATSNLDKEALLESRSSVRPVMTPSISVAGGDTAFHFLVPIVENDRLEGFVVGLFSGREVYPAALHVAASPGWSLAVYEGPRLLYASGSPLNGRWFGEARATVADRERRVRTSPSPDVVARIHGPLPGVALGAGSLIAVLLATAIGLAQSARQRARDAEAAEAGRSESETRTKAVLDAALDAVVTMDTQGLVTSWNTRAGVLFGFQESEALGRELAELIVPERYRDRHRAGLARFLATGEGPVLGRRVELTALRRDGTEFPVELTVTVLRGRRPSFSAFIDDITERKQSLHRLRAQHVATRALAESTTLAEAAPKMLAAVTEALRWDVSALWTMDQKTQTLRCRTVWSPSDEAVRQFVALTRDLALAPGVGLAGRVWATKEPVWIRDIAADATLPRLDAALGEGLRSAFAFPIRFNGTVAAVAEFFSREPRERDDELLKIMVDLESQVEHFWQQRRAERAMQAAQDRLAHVLASSPAVLYSLRVDAGTLVPTWTSANIERLSGYTAEEVSGPEWWIDRLHPEDKEKVSGQQANLMSTGFTARDYRFRHKDGQYRWVHDEQVLIRTAAGDPAEVVGSWSEITALREAELRLAASEEQYRMLFDNNPHPMWVYADDTRSFLAVNEAAIRHYGFSREEFLALTLRDIRPPEEVSALEEFAARRKQSSNPGAFRSERVWKHRKKDGTVIDVEIAASPIEFHGRAAWLVLVSDVTEEKRLEAHVRQAQKIDSVGRLAGGIAHDFNNLLGVITGYGELLQRDVGPDHPAFGRIAEIRKAADRAAALTRQLLAFSRKQVLEPRVLDLNVVVRDIEKMLRRLIGEDIQLITVFDDAIGCVRADPGQLEQVIVNLAVNARDAMPHGGKLIIETANVDLDDGYVRSHPDARSGPHVMLALSDTGHGMDAKTVSQLFEPFFTTKEPGKGTGLGLATVHGIVRQSGGHVSVYTESGRGTTFKVYLPRSDGQRESQAAPSAAIAAAVGTETILLVEDEPSLRMMIGEILQAAGYLVLEGPSPEEALAIAGSYRGPISLMLTDVILPRMSGPQIAEALRPSRPDTRVLFMSGYTDDAIGHHGILAPGVHFLQKPFTSESLLHKVRDVLDEQEMRSPALGR